MCLSRAFGNTFLIKNLRTLRRAQYIIALHMQHTCTRTSLVLTPKFTSPSNEFVTRYPNEISYTRVLRDRARDFGRPFLFGLWHNFSPLRLLFSFLFFLCSKKELKRMKRKRETEKIKERIDPRAVCPFLHVASEHRVRHRPAIVLADKSPPRGVGI